jgi:hypothetical protein
MKTIDNVLNRLTEMDADAMIVRPATDKDIKLCNKDFAKCGINLTLPYEYVNFLKQLNGFAWNGIELYSTDQVTDTDTDYMLNDIVSANEHFRRVNEGFEHCFYFGRADEDLYVNNTQNKKWEVLDMTGRDVMEEYDSFEDLFVAVVGGRI